MSESGTDHGITSGRGGVNITLRAVPRSSKTQLILDSDGHFRLKITAPPVEGAANAEITQYLAKTLGVRKSDVELVHGKKGRLKTFYVAGISAQQARSSLLRVAG